MSEGIRTPGQDSCVSPCGSYVHSRQGVQTQQPESTVAGLRPSTHPAPACSRLDDHRALTAGGVLFVQHKVPGGNVKVHLHGQQAHTTPPQHCTTLHCTACPTAILCSACTDRHHAACSQAPCFAAALQHSLSTLHKLLPQLTRPDSHTPSPQLPSVCHTHTQNTHLHHGVL